MVIFFFLNFPSDFIFKYTFLKKKSQYTFCEDDKYQY